LATRPNKWDDDDCGGDEDDGDDDGVGSRFPATLNGVYYIHFCMNSHNDGSFFLFLFF
jgi:hypothetical protein